MKTYTFTCNSLMLPAAIIVASSLISSASAQIILHDNGPLSTGKLTESREAEPSGGDWSELQHDALNMLEANNVLGYSTNLNAAGTIGGHRVADDFIVPDGKLWLVAAIFTFGYKTGASAIESPFDEAHVQIWKGQPGVLGSYTVFGDLTTNRLVDSDDQMIFRIANTQVPSPGVPPDSSRRIWRNHIMIGDLPLALTGGHYWIEWQTSDTADGPNFVPPVISPGNRTLPGWNARHVFGDWAALIDGGNPISAPDVPQDLPFQVLGSHGNNCTIPLKHCAADVAPVDATDGSVDVLDLLAVIGSWGLDGNATGERPLGDTHPGTDGNGDCKVDVLDLLAVIGSWGPCPPPLGACCMPDGDCNPDQLLADCQKNGGTYAGDFSACGTFDCPVTR